MRYLLSIACLSILLSGELEVDGNLKVTGNIQAGTIDSLQQVIQDLQSQLSALQGGNRLETRVYELNFNTLPNNSGNHGNTKYFSIPDLVGFDGRFIIYPYAYLDEDCGDNIYFSCEGGGGNIKYTKDGLDNLFNSLNCSEQNSWSELGNGPIFSIEVVNSTTGCWNADFELWITSEFPPDSDTQLRKTDLQSNDKNKAESK